MQDYIVTFTEDGSKVTQRSFAELLAPRVAGLTRSGTGWQFAGTLFLVAQGDDAFRLNAQLRDLFDFLSSVFAVPMDQRTAVTFSQPESSEAVVVIHNSASQMQDQFELANMRFVDAGDLLISFDVFQVTFPTLFRDIDDGGDPDAAYPTVTLAPAAGFLLEGLAPVTPDTETQVILILTNPADGASGILQDVVGAATAEAYDDDHFIFVDPDSGLTAEALDFVSDQGPVIELRLTVAQNDVDLLPALLAARLAGRAETAHLVIDEDFESFSFQVRPIGLKGVLGAAFTLTYEL